MRRASASSPTTRRTANAVAGSPGRTPMRGTSSWRKPEERRAPRSAWTRSRRSCASTSAGRWSHPGGGGPRSRRRGRAPGCASSARLRNAGASSGMFRHYGGRAPRALSAGGSSVLARRSPRAQPASCLRPCRMPLTAATTAKTIATTGWPSVHQAIAAAENTAISTSAWPNRSTRKTAFGDANSAHSEDREQRRTEADEHARPRQRERDEAPDAERHEREELEEEAEDVVRADLRLGLVRQGVAHGIPA